MATPTRTIGPLHLEDLEPHRFEDLIRQLLYDFREWRSLEATGRSGGDEGFDARGWEVVRGASAEVDREDEDDDEQAEKTLDRIWLIQCKREKAIGPTKLGEYLDAIPEAERKEIYGIVFAAACDFSKKARDVFREKAREFGFSEAYLWGKGEIEDQLFQPKNDHLLFAYCGVSLQLRKRSLKTLVRAQLAMKRKAKRLLENHRPVLIRDTSDDRYPYLNEDETLSRFDRGRWRVFDIEGCRSDGVRIRFRRHFAFLDDDGERWDYAERMNDAQVMHDNPWPHETTFEWEDRSAAMTIWEALPEKNRAWFEMFYVLPYENIIDIDEHGDEYFQGAHVYTTEAHPVDGPFLPDVYVRLQTIGSYDARRAEADVKKRVKKFARKKTGNTKGKAKQR